MKVIGICGTNGSGKGTVVDILEKYFTLTHISAREMIIEAAKNEGVKIESRDDFREYNEQRNKEGKTLVNEIKNKFKKSENENRIFVFESIRRVGEIKEFREDFKNNFLLVSVYAPVEIRYHRILKRASIADSVDFSKFVEQEKLESINEDENQMNITKCILMSDIHLVNDGDLAKFEEEVKNKLLPVI